MKTNRKWLSGLGSLLLAAATLLLSACHGSSSSTPPPLGTPTTQASKIKHVFMIMLENKSYADTFGTSTQDPYLQKNLIPQGAMLTQYFGTGHVSLDNYISVISGQAPTQDTDNDCIPALGTTGQSGQYINVAQTGTTTDGYSQVVATGGCVYPNTVQTLPDQLSAAGLTWKGYMEDMGNDSTRESATCGHPTLGGTDGTNNAEAPSSAVPAGDAYATRHDPFAYFHTITDSADCATHVVALPTYFPSATSGQVGYQPANSSALAADLSSYATTPNFVFITPNLCNDGHDGDGTGATGKGCANGQPGGLTSADAFLKYWIPIILASPAYQQDGMIVITFDEGNYTQTVSVANGVTTVGVTFPGLTCCNQQPGPNLAGVRPATFKVPLSATMNEVLSINGYGGDNVGALILSPFIKPGSTSSTQYNHYALLRSLEQIFGLPSYLGYANDPTLSRVGDDKTIFN